MIEIIPAIDLMDGRCVRLTHGNFERSTVYSDKPLEAAKRFEAAGIRRLHVVDLDGAKSGSPKNLAVLANVAENTDLEIDFGGGVRSETDLENVFGAGAAMANIGSIAMTDPEMFLDWVERYGSDRILLGADAKEGNIAVDGWQTETQIEIMDVLTRYAHEGVRNIFVTDIASDGAMTGPATELYERIVSALPDLRLIASGGVRTMRDVDELERIGCAGVIIGKAIYEGHITTEDLTNYVG
jgi:phosphoribosylformimino-5-aminoimidazole carboxamide ribotide isomerase